MRDRKWQRPFVTLTSALGMSASRQRRQATCGHFPSFEQCRVSHCNRTLIAVACSIGHIRKPI